MRFSPRLGVATPTGFTESPAMPCRHPIYSWIDQVVTAFPHLSRPRPESWLFTASEWSWPSDAASTPWPRSWPRSLARAGRPFRSRLQKFYQPAQAKSGGRRAQLEVSRCFAPLLAWVLRGWPSRRMAVALDATTLGDRLIHLMKHDEPSPQRHSRGVKHGACRDAVRLPAGRADGFSPRIISGHRFAVRARVSREGAGPGAGSKGV
jgi:hypothetical protein